MIKWLLIDGIVVEAWCSNGIIIQLQGDEDVGKRGDDVCHDCVDVSKE